MMFKMFEKCSRREGVSKESLITFLFDAINIFTIGKPLTEKFNLKKKIYILIYLINKQVVFQR